MSDIQFVYTKIEGNSPKLRDCQFAISCPDCQWERIVTYAQFWNIKKGNSSAICKPCNIASGKIKINMSGLSLGRKFHSGKKERTDFVFNKKQMETVACFGLIFNPESKEKMRKAKLGKYKKTNKLDRKTEMSRDEYKELRKLVFKRDNYSCVICSKTNCYIEMDHIKEWCNYPELRYDSNNCRTLCKDCHKKTENYAFKAIKRGN